MPDIKNPDDWVNDKLEGLFFNLCADMHLKSTMIVTEPPLEAGAILLRGKEIIMVVGVEGRKARVARAYGHAPIADKRTMEHRHQMVTPAGSTLRLIGRQFAS